MDCRVKPRQAHTATDRLITRTTALIPQLAYTGNHGVPIREYLHGEAPQNGADRAHLRPTCGQKSLQDRPSLAPPKLSVIRHSMFRVLLIFLCCAVSAAARADSCPGNPDALATERVLAVDARISARVGRKQFPDTLPLSPKEVVLTFDDGPWPTTTPAVLDALRGECVQATFFLLGRNVIANPELARREHDEGHTIAYHTFDHRLLDRMPLSAAEAEIDRGIIAVNSVVYSRADARPIAPFFRFPGFASSPALLDRLNSRGIVIFGADLWASDWNPMTPEQELRLVMARLRAEGGGIVLLHDTRAETAAMLPELLKELKNKGYHVVHVAPAGVQPAGHPSQAHSETIEFLWKSKVIDGKAQ